MLKVDAGKKTAAERALRALLPGATIVGARWYGTLIAVLAREFHMPDGRPYDIAYREIDLSIESRFVLFAERPVTLPNRAEDVPDSPFHEQVATIARAARDPIAVADLGERHPHLILTLESGRVLFLDGYDEEFEPWSVQTWGARGGERTIVAVPGGDIATFMPTHGVQPG